MDNKEIVKKYILENAAIDSESISREINADKTTLLNIYNELKGALPKLPDKPFGAADVIRRILERDVLSDPGKIQMFRTRSFTFPDSLEVHLGPACQCACRFCWRWVQGQWREGETGLYKNNLIKKADDSLKDTRDYLKLLNEKDIKRLFSEFKNYGGKRLFFSGGLEFFTSPYAIDAVRAANDLSIPINIYTNGVSDIFDDEAFLELLLKSSESIRMSIHANDPKTYAYTQMPHRDIDIAEREFFKVKKHLENIIAIRDKIDSECEIGVAFLVIGKNMFELEDLIIWLHDIGVDRLDIRVDMMDFNNWFTRKEQEEFITIIKKIQERSLSNIYYPMKINARIDESEEIRKAITAKMAHHCYIPQTKPTIDPWGYLFSCCYRAHPSLQEEKFLLGKYPEESLFSIINSNLNSGKLPFDFHCAQCTDWELCYNKCTEKVIKDWDFGIEPEKLPFV